MTFDINFIVLFCLNLKTGKNNLQKKIAFVSWLVLNDVLANHLLNKELFLVPRKHHLPKLNPANILRLINYRYHLKIRNIFRHRLSPQ